MCPKVEVILLTQSELIIVIIQTFLWESNHSGCILKTDFSEVIFGEVNLTPFLNYFNHFKYYSLFTALPLYRGCVRPNLLKLQRPDWVSAAKGRSMLILDFDHEDVGVLVVEERDGHWALLGINLGISVMLEVIGFDYFPLHAAHECA